VDSIACRKLWAATAAAIVVAAIAIIAASVPAAHGAGFPRPKGATPMRMALVPIFERCNNPAGGGRRANNTHGAPLNGKSCTNPEMVSGTLTIGTPDANGKQANSIGNLTYIVVPDNTATPADEADVRVNLDISDVRLATTLDDYPGQLRLDLESRFTDMANGPAGNEPGTVEDFFWEAPVNCATTASTTIGSTCSLHTTVDALVPNTIKGGKRMIWEEVDHPHIWDGGADWTAATEDDNLVFQTMGLFVP
jgi:hypothetical protein